MITLYYLNKNHDIETMELPSFDTCIPLKESGIFIAYRDGINFIKNPPEIFPFTNLERLIIGTEFFDTNYIKESDFRKQNTQFCPLVPHIEPFKANINGIDIETGFILLQTNKNEFISFGVIDLMDGNRYYSISEFDFIPDRLSSDGTFTCQSIDIQNLTQSLKNLIVDPARSLFSIDTNTESYYISSTYSGSVYPTAHSGN